MNLLRKQIGQRLAVWRDKAHQTQASVAEKMGVAVSTIHHIEHGTIKAQLETLGLYCEAVGHSLAELFAEKSDISPDQARLIELTRGLNQAEMRLLFDDLEMIHERRSRLLNAEKKLSG